MARQQKTIQQLMDDAKNQSKSVQSFGIQVPSLVNQFSSGTGGSTNNNDALVYTVINLLDEGTDPTGSPTPSNISFCLPPPTQIIDLHSANWEGVSFAEKQGRLNDVKGTKSIMAAAAGGIGSAYDFLTKLGEGAKDVILSGQSNLSVKDTLLASKIIFGEDVYNLYSIGTRTAINPNIELAFRSANLRNMQLNFRLVPLKEQDANNIRKFADKMKLMMYARSDFLWATGYPAKFSVQVKTSSSGGGPWSNKILFSLGNSATNISNNNPSGCVLTDFQVSYGDGGVYAGHYDGSPGVVDLSLTFQETVLSTRESILREYDIKGI